MIRYNGYYITEPIPFEEGRDSKNQWYSCSGYLFQNNGKFIMAIKFSKNNTDIHFYESDFLDDNINSFEIDEYGLILKINEGKEWETQERLEVISNTKFRMINGRILSFKNWSK